MFPHANEGGTEGVVGGLEEATPFSDLKNDTRTILIDDFDCNITLTLAFSPPPFITKEKKERDLLHAAGHGWT